MIPGADISNFSGIPTTQVLSEMWAAGYRWFDVGTQRGADGIAWTQPQIDAILAFEPPDGVNPLTGDRRFSIPGLYELLYWNTRDAEKMQHMASFKMPSRIDVEEVAPPGWTPDLVVGRILEAEGILEADGVIQGIYTSAAKWRELTGDSPAFTRHEAWVADYLADVQRRRPVLLDLSRVKVPTPWARERMRVWQYTDQGFQLSTGEIFNCDLNIWIEDQDWVDLAAAMPGSPPAPAPDPEAMEEDELFVASEVESAWWKGDDGNGRALPPTPSGTKYTMQARGDDELPPAAVEVVFDVFLKQGRIRFYHGDSGKEAADIGWDGAPRQGTVRAKLTAAGELSFVCELAPGDDPNGLVVVDHIKARGYYV